MVGTGFERGLSGCELDVPSRSTVKVLVTGAGGMLGQDILATAPEGFDVVGLRRAQLDVTDEKAVRAAVRQLRAHVVINCAAYTAVDRAESEPELAEAVNALAPGILGRAGPGVVVHFSTDYVFDGAARQP